MVKNTASQVIGAQVVNASTGAAFTGSVTAYVTIDGGTQAAGSVGSGACTHEGNGYHSYTPSQAETNGDLLAFTFTGSGAIPVTVQVFTITGALATAAALQTVDDEIATLDGVADGIKAVTDNLPDSGALSSLATAAALSTVDGNVDSILADTADMQPKLGTPAADVSADIAAVKAQTAAIETDTQDIQTQVGTAGAGLTDLGGMSTTMKAQVNTEADTALSDYDPPTRTEATADKDEVLAVLGTPANTDVAGDLADIEGKVDDLEGRLTATRAGYLDNLSGGAAALESTAQSILTDTAEIGAAGAGLTEAGGTGDHLTAIATAAALTTVDGVADGIKTVTDALTAAAAAKLAASALGIITGTVDTGSFSSTTTQFEADDITEATADHYIGRIVTFTSGVLLGQSTDITDYALSGSNGHFTVTALTDAPGNNDTFVIS